MINQIFTVFDNKAAAYLSPFYFNRIEQATRTFGDCVQSEEHQFNKHPADYTLFHLGNFNDQTAEVQMLASPNNLGNGLEFQLTNQPEPDDVAQFRQNTNGNDT